MVTKCIIKFCNTIKSGDGVTLHKLPSNADTQKEWFRAILNETGQTVFSEDDVICSKHFDPLCFTVIDGNPVLNPTAVPFESFKSEGPETKRIKKEKDRDKAVRCSVFNCENSLTTTAVVRPELLYYPFPKKADLIESWKIFCNRENDDQAKCNYVCSDHFTGDSYNQKRTRGKTLKADAVPTIYKKEALTTEELENGVEPPEADLTGATASKIFSQEMAIGLLPASNRDNFEDKPQTFTECGLIKMASKIRRRCSVCYERLKTIKDRQHAMGAAKKTRYKCQKCNCPFCVECFFIKHKSFKRVILLKIHYVPFSTAHRQTNLLLQTYTPQTNVRKKWLKVIETNTTQNNLPNTAVVCSLHFAEDCFKSDKENRKILLAHAVPSIFPTPKIEKGDFPVMKPADFSDPKRGRDFYEWSMKNYQEQKNKIKFLKYRARLQSKRIARLAKSVDDFKAKRFVSEDANNALQNLFDKIIDAQYDVI